MKFLHLFLIIFFALTLAACGPKVESPSLWEIYDPIGFTPDSLRTGYDVVIEPIAESDLPGYGQKVEGVAIYMVAEVVSNIDPGYSALYVAEVYSSVSMPNGYTLADRKTFFKVYQQVNEQTAVDQIWNPIGQDAAAVMSTLCVQTAQKMGVSYFCPTVP